MKFDQDLIENCKKGQTRAQLELFKKSYGYLMSICFRYHKDQDHARFLLNEAFYKILKGLKSYKHNAPFLPWIKRIMMNVIIDDFRKNEKNIIDIQDLQEMGNEKRNYTYNQADLEFDAEELRALLWKLPESTRQVFNMYAIDGYSHKEIAETMQISVGTSKWHVSFARKQLKEWIAEKMYTKSSKQQIS